MPEERIFRFAQFEFPWVLGPADGRYVQREAAGADPRHILVIGTLGAPQRRLLSRRSRPRDAEPEPAPTAVTTTRATLIDAAGLTDDEAVAWRKRMTGDAAQEALLEGLAALNRVLHAHRLATADPFVSEVSLEQALVARLGHGRGERVADGLWDEAVEVPALPVRRRRVAALRPQERLAALLGGTDAPLACEDLTLRARMDLDAGRAREAALQLRVALEAALAELEERAGRAPDIGQRLSELREQRGIVGAAANEAVRGALEPATIGEVDHAIGRLEAALRARSAAGFR